MGNRVKTPHAAIKIWNYQDRIQSSGANASLANVVSEEIISTISCIAIQTVKTKSDPAGQFNFVLAPTRNWVAVLTPGSWCTIMMSNKPFTQDSFIKADPQLIKMIGKIDSVRAEVTTDDEGTRQTRYLVSGQDWGHIFNNTLYIDPLISDPKDTDRQGNALYSAIIEGLNTDNGLESVSTNLTTLLSIFGKPIKTGGDVGRLAKATYTFLMPKEMIRFFGFVDSTGSVSSKQQIVKLLKLQTGKVDAGGTYKAVSTGSGIITPPSLIGIHSFWQLLMDNCNYSLNEMFTEINWKTGGPQLTLFSRVKPFAYLDNPLPNSSISLRAKFQNLPTHKIDASLVTLINAGTNWRDKVNFIEIKTEWPDLDIVNKMTKPVTQAYDKNNTAFNREGFRPLIFNIKQFPLQKDANGIVDFTRTTILNWVSLMREWYFDTHRMLNGQLTMTGSTDYIAVGNNILFDAGLLGVTPNLNTASFNDRNTNYILAHVESVKHSFSVNSDGSRQFQTVIEFVRGIVVDSNNKVIGTGSLDVLATTLPKNASKNSVSTVESNSKDIPLRED